jgi:purine-nucleoside phosphorylase
MLPEEINEAVFFIRTKTDFKPVTGIILGTGLGALVNELEVVCAINYTDIPHFVTSTVASHKGRLIFGVLNGVDVVVMQGRFHFYEGYTMKQVAFPVYVMKKLGIEKLLISNISGSLNPGIKAGDLVIINDHINLQTENPLRGKNFDELGPRFPDMSEPYDHELIAKASELAQSCNIRHHQGVYVSVPGPNLETRAEYRYLRLIGGDCVGMSTVPEVIAANHVSLPVFAVAIITDEAFPDVPQKLTLEGLLKVAAEAEPRLAKIIKGLV